jgi:hypothetical protein
MRPRDSGQEQKVELAALGGLSHFDRLGEACARFGMRIGMTPRRNMLPRLMNEGAEMHHAAVVLLRHALALPPENADTPACTQVLCQSRSESGEVI